MSDVLVSLALIVLCLGPGFLAGWVSRDLWENDQYVSALLLFLAGSVLTYGLCYSVLYPTLEVVWQ